jgi:hypothetical protein
MLLVSATFAYSQLCKGVNGTARKPWRAAGKSIGNVGDVSAKEMIK